MWASKLALENPFVGVILVLLWTQRERNRDWNYSLRALFYHPKLPGRKNLSLNFRTVNMPFTIFCYGKMNSDPRILLILFATYEFSCCGKFLAPSKDVKVLVICCCIDFFNLFISIPQEWVPLIYWTSMSLISLMECLCLFGC